MFPADHAKDRRIPAILPRYLNYGDKVQTLTLPVLQMPVIYHQGISAGDRRHPGRLLPFQCPLFAGLGEELHKFLYLGLYCTQKRALV